MHAYRKFPLRSIRYIAGWFQSAKPRTSRRKRGCSGAPSEASSLTIWGEEGSIAGSWKSSISGQGINELRARKLLSAGMLSSDVMPRTSKPRAWLAEYILAMVGSSATQSGHQVAQKSTRITSPFHLAVENDAPLTRVPAMVIG